MEVIQLYLALNCLSFLIPSITGAGKAAIIICMSLTKETIVSYHKFNFFVQMSEKNRMKKKDPR